MWAIRKKGISVIIPYYWQNRISFCMIRLSNQNRRSLSTKIFQRNETNIIILHESWINIFVVLNLLVPTSTFFTGYKQYKGWRLSQERHSDMSFVLLSEVFSHDCYQASMISVNTSTLETAGRNLNGFPPFFLCWPTAAFYTLVDMH